MREWTIWPISVGTMMNVEKSNLTYGRDQGQKIDICSLIYLIRGGKELILVDTGMSDADWATKYHHPSTRDESQDPVKALANLGVAPDEISYLICTHLHWDHSFNTGLFKNAQILVQKDEIPYALCPLPIHALYYEAFSLNMTPPWLKDAGRFHIIDGDLELVPGISIVKLPSHTPGFQGVNVETSKGNYFIGSDFCPLFENWPGKEGTPIYSGVHISLLDYHDSFMRVNRFADFILPGHDTRLLEYKSYPK